MATRYAISVDVGGTFTDFVLFDMDAGETAADLAAAAGHADLADRLREVAAPD